VRILSFLQECKNSCIANLSQFKKESSLYKMVSSRFPLPSQLQSPRNFHICLLLTGAALVSTIVLRLFFRPFSPLESVTHFQRFYHSLPQTKGELFRDKNGDVVVRARDMQHCIEAGGPYGDAYIFFRIQRQSIGPDGPGLCTCILQQSRIGNSEEPNWTCRFYSDFFSSNYESWKLPFTSETPLFGNVEDCFDGHSRQTDEQGRQQELRHFISFLIESFYRRKATPRKFNLMEWGKFTPTCWLDIDLTLLQRATCFLKIEMAKHFLMGNEKCELDNLLAIEGSLNIKKYLADLSAQKAREDTAYYQNQKGKK
jgi:hypothetical protein